MPLSLTFPDCGTGALFSRHFNETESVSPLSLTGGVHHIFTATAGMHHSFPPLAACVSKTRVNHNQKTAGKRIHDQRGVHSPNPHSMASKLLPPTTFSVEHGVQFSREITQHVIDVFEECILGACTVEQTETNISRHSSKTRTNDDETETGWPIQCKDWYSKGPCIYKTTIYMSTNGNFKNLEANYIIHIWYH